MIQKIKDYLSATKEFIIILLFMIFIFFPSKINSVLTKAGFTKGSLMGFDWEKQIEDSRDSLVQANEQVINVKEQLKNIVPQLDQLKRNAITTSDKKEVESLTDSLQSSVSKINKTTYMLQRNVEVHDNLLKIAKENN